MNFRNLWTVVERWYAGHSPRDRRIVLGLVSAIGLSLLWVGVVDPIRDYRRHVAEETEEGVEQLERAARFLGAADSLRAERDQLRKRLEQVKSRLLPGDSGTLGAAALQERANAVAADHGISVQSTQVMREETVEPFRKVSVRLTLPGDIKSFANFVAGLEYDKQLLVPFVEVSRRGATGSNSPRTISSTLEVSGYVHPAPQPAAGTDSGEPAPAPTEGDAPAAPAAEGST